MRVEVEADSVPFTHEGKDYYTSGTVIHNTETEDVGIGSYEFWGSRGFDSCVVEASDFGNAEFEDVTIGFKDDTNDIENPSKELVDAAEEALYLATQERAEEKATEMVE